MDAASLALTTDQSWIIERNNTYRERRDIVLAAVRAAGMAAEVPAGAIYVWARLPAHSRFASETDYATALLETEGVTVTPGPIFGAAGTGYVRLSLGTPTDRLKEAMGRVVRFGV